MPAAAAAYPPPDAASPGDSTPRPPGSHTRRSVRHLSEGALAKKRANDREAQRNIREKTRQKIEGLERRVRELETGEAFQQLQSVIQKNEELEGEVRYLRLRLHRIHEDTADAMDDRRKGSDATGTTTVQQYPSPTSAPSGGAAYANGSSWSKPATHNAPPSPFHGSPKYGAWNSPGHALTPCAAAARSYAHSPMSTTSSQEQQPRAYSAAGENRPPSPAAAATAWPAQNTIASFKRLHSARIHSYSGATPQAPYDPPYWARLPNNSVSVDTDWDNHIRPIIQEKKRLLAAGGSELDVLGRRPPDFTHFHRVYNTPVDPENPDPSLTNFVIMLIKAFNRVNEPPTQIAVIANVYFFLRWYIAPTRENYEYMPNYMRPTQIPISRFKGPYSTTINIDWPQRDGFDTILARDEEGEVTMSPAFHAHNLNLDNWTLTALFDKELPELVGSHIDLDALRRLGVHKSLLGLVELDLLRDQRLDVHLAGGNKLDGSRVVALLVPETDLDVQLLGHRGHEWKVDVSLAHARLDVRGAAPTHMYGLLDAHLGAARIDGHVGTIAQVALLLQPGRALQRRFALAGQEAVRGGVLSRKIDARLVDVDDDGGARAVRPRDGQAQQPDGAGAVDDDLVARLDAREAHDVHRDAQRLDQRALLQRHVVWQLLAEVGRQRVVAAQGAVHRRRRRELHVLAQVVSAFFAAGAAPARDTRLHGDADHGLFDDEGADAAVRPVVHVGAADAGEAHVDQHIVGRRELGQFAVDDGDVIGLVEEEGGVVGAGLDGGLGLVVSVEEHGRCGRPCHTEEAMTEKWIRVVPLGSRLSRELAGLP
ncbi:hypothetical protein FH972_025055 [Carpinus fangiana]|uniref:BZIP domain-containing protein n=1 Tax=Carpinus fangiana TaxID=176857 RepID=A0A5N6L051_9ROSI|nr:hypothetical protein FH972_025055 [Carpinus fangiana]